MFTLKARDGNDAIQIKYYYYYYYYYYYDYYYYMVF